MGWIYFFGILAILGLLYYLIDWIIINKIWIIVVSVIGIALLLFLLLKFLIPFIKKQKKKKQLKLEKERLESIKRKQEKEKRVEELIQKYVDKYNNKKQEEQTQKHIEKSNKERQEYIEKNNIYKKTYTYIPIQQENIKTKQNFYNEQLERCTKCEKVYYETLYKKYSDKYTIKAQVFLRSMFAGYGAENHKIDIVFFNKQTDKPELLIEINDYTHKDLLRRARDKDLKEFCNTNNIKLQFLYTKFGCSPKSIYHVIDKKLQE